MKDLAYWPALNSVPKDDKFTLKRKDINNLDHVDQIWEYLKFKCGDTIAINDLRGKNKEKFSYSELANLITKASKSVSYTHLTLPTT